MPREGTAGKHDYNVDPLPNSLSFKVRNKVKGELVICLKSSPQHVGISQRIMSKWG